MKNQQEEPKPHVIDLEMMTSVPAEKELGWKYELQATVKIIDEKGKEHTGKVTEITTFEAAVMASKFGRWEAGIHPGGYGAWLFREGPTAGVHGSSLNVIFTIDPDGQMWVGGHMRRRANIQGKTLEMFDLGGGFADPDDVSEIATALRESLEEQGVVIKPITGANLAPGIWNRLFQFVPAGGGNTHGVVPSMVEWNTLIDKGNGRMGFSNPQIDLSALDADEEAKEKALGRAEQAANLVFIPALVAMARAQDDIVVSCIARVFAAHQLDQMSSPYADIH
jgi:hypothetical protein